MKVAVLASGGVDSSTALCLLKEQGFDITAFYLKIWLEEETAFLGQCPWEEDLEYVRNICARLDVPLEILPMQQQYYDQIVSYTIEELKDGRTPSPDVLCNRHIKFGQVDREIGHRFDKIATGHYARTGEQNGKALLLANPDPVKDQTYFLSHMTQQQVAKAMFPIGDYTKQEVRALARKYNLPNKDRKDSQGICFLGKIKYRDFVKFHLGTKTGDIVEKETGKKIGIHDGFWFYTLGQRSGLGLSGGPWFVVDKDTDKNIVFVSQTNDLDSRLTKSFDVIKMNWIAFEPEKNRLELKLRHGPTRVGCVIEKTAELVKVTLDDPQTGVANGQFAVFYDGDICLGSGVISRHSQ